MALNLREEIESNPLECRVLPERKRVESCPLCTIRDRPEEKIFYDDGVFSIVRTKKLKGHQDRIMILFNDHYQDYVTDWMTDHAMNVLEREGKKIFRYAYKFVIMHKTFGTIPDHWHKVATDLDPASDDFEQILGTPWIKVVDVKKWRK